MTTASSASYMSIPQLGETSPRKHVPRYVTSLTRNLTAEYASSKAAVLALHEVLTAELVHRSVLRALGDPTLYFSYELYK